jgi:hypothetical protein
MSSYAHVYIEQRGSVVIPSTVRKALGLTTGSCCVLREYNGVLFLLPVEREDENATPERIHALVCSRLERPLEPPPPPQPVVSKTATAEALKLQAAREKHAFRMEELNAKLRVVEAEAHLRMQAKEQAHQNAMARQPQPTPRPAPRDPTTDPEFTDPLEALMKQRQEYADRSLNEALAKASEEMAGEHTIPFNPSSLHQS